MAQATKSDEPAGRRSGPGRPKASEGIQARTNLLVAARAVFGAKGYDGASLEEIITLAGVSYPTLYHHFGNKAGVYTAAAFQAYADVLTQYTAWSAKAVDGRSKVQAAIDTGVAMVRRDRMLAMFLHDLPLEMRRHPELEAGQRAVLDFRDAVRSAVEEGIADGSLPSADPERLTEVVSTLLSGLQSHAVIMPLASFKVVAQHVRSLFDEDGSLQLLARPQATRVARRR